MKIFNTFLLTQLLSFMVFSSGIDAGVLPEGTYRITNVASHSPIRVSDAGGQLFASSTREVPGPYDLWNIKNAQDGGYTLENVGLSMAFMPDTFAAVSNPRNMAPCVTNRNPTVFKIESAGNGEFIIQLPSEDLLWNVEPPVMPRGTIDLSPADGSGTKKFIFTAVEWPPA